MDYELCRTELEDRKSRIKNKVENFIGVRD